MATRSAQDGDGGRRAGTLVEIGIPTVEAVLRAFIGLPPPLQATVGVVVFAHGSGSSRHSRRNQFVAGSLQASGLATVLLDLLTDDEANDRRNVFDVELLARRLRHAGDWARSTSDPPLAALPIGYFGASTGAAAALIAAAHDQRVAAIVSRGGRPDLAGQSLEHVVAPTLLIVGGADTEVLSLNRDAASHLLCEHELVVVPGATHLFEEPGTLEQVAHLACEWFLDHLVRPNAA